MRSRETLDNLIDDLSPSDIDRAAVVIIEHAYESMIGRGWNLPEFVLTCYQRLLEDRQLGPEDQLDAKTRSHITVELGLLDRSSHSSVTQTFTSALIEAFSTSSLFGTEGSREHLHTLCVCSARAIGFTHKGNWPGWRDNERQWQITYLDRLVNVPNLSGSALESRLRTSLLAED